MKKGLRREVVEEIESLLRECSKPRPDEEGIETKTVEPVLGIMVQVPNLDLMKKGLRQKELPFEPVLFARSSKPRPDEEGIETLIHRLPSKIPDIVPNLDLMKKGLRHKLPQQITHFFLFWFQT